MSGLLYRIGGFAAPENRKEFLTNPDYLVRVYLEGGNMSESDYIKYRGKCKEMSEALVKADPSLTLVRGHYICPLWGAQPHWWVKDLSGKVIDPTVKQFPSGGLGEYVEFNGHVECAQCGKDMTEETATFESNYAFCSGRCYGRFVGVYV